MPTASSGSASCRQGVSTALTAAGSWRSSTRLSGVTSVATPASAQRSSRSIAASMAAAASSGSSPCTLTITSASGNLGSASTIRAVPLGASGEVITGSPPKARTAAAISSLSVTTTTCFARAEHPAARQVCSMRGRPVSASSILRGRRWLESRAGIAMMAGERFMAEGPFSQENTRVV